jgi:hypothetical protein
VYPPGITGKRNWTKHLGKHFVFFFFGGGWGRGFAYQAKDIVFSFIIEYV